jgi:hypothetical protein
VARRLSKRSAGVDGVAGLHRVHLRDWRRVIVGARQSQSQPNEPPLGRC